MQPSNVGGEVAALLEGISDAALLVDSGGAIQFANARCAALFGYLREELIGRQVEDLVPADSRAVHRDHRRQYGHAPLPRPMGRGRDLVALHADGGRIPVEISLSPVRIAGEAYTLALVSDIRERKRIEQELQDERDFVRAVLDTADALVIVADSEGRVVRFNRACERLTGRREADMVGRSLIDSMVPADSRADLRARLDDLATTQIPASFETDWVGADGGRRTIAWTWGVMTGRHDEVRYLIGKGIDVTRQKIHQEAMAQAGKMAAIGEMAGNLAHEINNPIGIISAKARLLLSTQGQGLDDKARNELKKIVDQCDRLSRLTRRLLDFSRPSPREREAIDIRVPLRSALGMVADRIARQNVHLIERYAARSHTVYADDNELQQVFLNLLINALDVMPDGGTLSLSSFSEGRLASGQRAVEVAVGDTGPGVPPEALGRIFEPFFTTKGPTGTGLGLSICKGLVRSMEGELVVTNGESGGAVFSVRLPRADVELSPA